MSRRSLASRHFSQNLAFTVFRLIMLTVLAALGGILLYVFIHGISAISWEFLTAEPTNSMTAGGIFPAIMGTLYLTVGAILVALPLGVAAAIYLSEYATDGRTLRIVRLGIQNLAGVPSVVFGLFGLALFVGYFHLGISIAAGSLTLGLLILPTIIGASEEALRQVPSTFREASLGLGATRWQTIRKVVLPAALPGILTGSILGIGRAAGETAPIMFTAAYVVRDKLPWDVEQVTDFFFQGVMALPYHIYVVSSKIPQNEYTQRVQYGTAFVFLGIVAGIALTSILLRNKLRGRYKW
ncbi:MAG: phosphate ABC transporter permease PstA [Pseudomonadota bacterium]